MKNSVRVGFSRISLDSATDEVRTVNESIEGIFVYFECSETRALWATLDYMDFNKALTDTVGEKIGEALGLSREHIHVLTTHNHGGGCPNPERLAELCAMGALSARDNAKYPKMRYAFTRTDKQLTILRRLYIPEIEGVSTIFYGVTEKSGFDSSLYRSEVIRALTRGAECHTVKETSDIPTAPFPEGDNEIFVAEFIDEEGAPIGSIVRFSSHAVCANRPGVYSSDYPHYLRRKMEECFGGVSLFLNGPCAEIAPAMTDKFEGREKILGEYLAVTAHRAVKDEEFTEIYCISDEKAEIFLPVRDEVLKMAVDIPESMPDSLPERRKYLEKKALLRTLPFLNEKYSEGESALTDKVGIKVGFLELNDLVFTAFPGETFSKTARAVKDSFPEKKIVTVTEHERTVMYLPPKEDFDLGGYESVCKLTGRDAEEILRLETIRLLSEK